MKTIPLSTTTVCQLNIEGGKIPIRLSLATTSIRTTTVPDPIHVLISQQTFLPVGLESVAKQT